MRFLFSLPLLLHSLGALAAPLYEPGILVEIGHRVEQVRDLGQTPVVIFDLDDTLIDTRQRTDRILRTFASDATVESQFPADSARLAQVQEQGTFYQLSDTLAALGISDAPFAQALSNYWVTAFFSNQFCATDIEERGASNYVRYLARQGAKIVYLTGRDNPRMGQGTFFSLGRNGFPLDGVNSILIMKPMAGGDDLAFKESQFAAIAGMGTVIASFENEPRNINAFAEYYSGAAMVLIDTIHSPAPDQPLPSVAWIHDFTGR